MERKGMKSGIEAMTDAELNARIEEQTPAPKTLKLMCAHDNRPVVVTVQEDGRIEGKCKWCGLKHTGTYKAWAGIRGDSIRLQAPLGRHKRLTINFE